MFLLKQIIARFLFPCPLCLEVLSIGLLLLWFTKKQKTGKALVTLAGILFFLFSTQFFSDLLLAPLENRYPPLVVTAQSRASAGLEEVKFIVVLGGGVSQDARRPAISRLNEASITRLVEGVRVYKELRGRKLVLSGRGPEHDALSSSAMLMAEIAQDLGVGREDIVLETQSGDTEDEARLVKPIVGEQSFILVTEASHMPRSMALFRKQGTHPIADPVAFHSRRAQAITPDTFFPSAGIFYGSERAVYEYLGLALEKFRGKI